MDVTRTATIAAPPHMVWAILSDYFGLAEWATEIDHASALTATPAGPGASRRVQVGSMTLVENVVEWEPEASVAYEIVGLPPVLSSVVNRWTIAPAASGTDVSLTATIVPGPKPPMKVAARAVGRRIGATNQKLVRDLTRRCEQEVDA